mgnify:CR=1 FL=1
MDEQEEKKIPTISQIHTACWECVFCKKDKKSGTQVGCEVDRLDVYEELGKEVIPVYDKHDNQFFVINDTICAFKRKSKWGEKIRKSERLDRVKKELNVRYMTIVHFKDSDSLDDLMKSLKSLDSQENPPLVVTILNRAKRPQREIIEFLNDQLDAESFEWRLQTTLIDDLYDRECIDLVIDAVKYEYSIQFYNIMSTGFVVPDGYSSKLNQWIVDKARFLAYCAGDENGNLELHSFMLHIKHGGNAFNIPLIEKIKEFEDEKVSKYIYELEELLA